MEATLPAAVANQLTIVDDAPSFTEHFSDLGGCLQNLFDPVMWMNRIMETRAQQIEVTSVDDSDLDDITVNMSANILLMSKDSAGTPDLKGIVS